MGRGEAAVLRATVTRLNAGIGVGFWAEADANAQARAEQARTGRPHFIVSKKTQHDTHLIWWVREAREEVA
ncbi:hypothetical protein ASF35_01930 [Aeromicrobium sp. Leaf291]|nr:hypothetical protein ASF35_01930 [Aeromicrobium sp. Leaf291]